MPFPDEPHVFSTRRDESPRGFLVQAESVVVPVEAPFAAYLQFAPKAGFPLTAAREAGGANFEEITWGLALGPGQYSVNRLGDLVFHPDDAGTALVFEYTGVGTVVRAGHLNEIQDQLVATQELLLTLNGAQAAAIASPPVTIFQGTFAGIQDGRTPVGQEWEFQVPGGDQARNYLVASIKVVHAYPTGTNLPTEVRVSTAAAGGDGDYKSVVLPAGARRTERATAGEPLIVVNDSTLYVFIEAANRGHSDISFLVELESYAAGE